MLDLYKRAHGLTSIGNDLLDMMKQFLLDIRVKSQQSESECKGVCSRLERRGQADFSGMLSGQPHVQPPGK